MAGAGTGDSVHGGGDWSGGVEVVDEMEVGAVSWG